RRAGVVCLGWYSPTERMGRPLFPGQQSLGQNSKGRSAVCSPAGFFCSESPRPGRCVPDPGASGGREAAPRLYPGTAQAGAGKGGEKNVRAGCDQKEGAGAVRGRRDQQLHFRVSKPELDRIQVKMAELGIVSIGAYLRKMALDGYCIRLDLQELNRMAYLLQMCSNNLNQYAKRANESGRVYQTDIEDLRGRLDELIDLAKQILAQLAVL